jgi:HEAT repeat protein
MARTALLAALRDSEPGVRMSVVSAFAFWNVQRDVIVVELAQALRDPHPSVRGNAVSVLGNFGSAARPAVPEVLKLLSDNASYVRGTVADRALQVLRRIDPEAAAQAGVK